MVMTEKMTVPKANSRKDIYSELYLLKFTTGAGNLMKSLKML